MQPADIAPKDRLIVALDLPGVAEAEAMIARIGDSVSFYKIGYQLACAGGLPLAPQLARSGKKVFLDLKMRVHHLNRSTEHRLSAKATGEAALVEKIGLPIEIHTLESTPI